MADEGFDAFLEACIGGYGMNAAAFLHNDFRGSGQALRILIDNDQARTFTCEKNRAGAAYAACRSRDDCNLTVESAHTILPCCSCAFPTLRICPRTSSQQLLIPADCSS